MSLIYIKSGNMMRKSGSNSHSHYWHCTAPA